MRTTSALHSNSEAEPDRTHRPGAVGTVWRPKFENSANPEDRRDDLALDRDARGVRNRFRVPAGGEYKLRRHETQEGRRDGLEPI